jgi:hypothetical protein
MAASSGLMQSRMPYYAVGAMTGYTEVLLATPTAQPDIFSRLLGVQA